MKNANKVSAINVNINFKKVNVKYKNSLNIFKTIFQDIEKYLLKAKLKVYL